jgi:hypothetical protein
VDKLPPAEHCFALLHRAGWSVVETCWLTAAGFIWRVDGRNGENAIRAEASTKRKAWLSACLRASALGMLRRGWEQP